MERYFIVDVTTCKYLDVSSTAKENCCDKSVSMDVHMKMLFVCKPFGCSVCLLTSEFSCLEGCFCP